MQRRQFEMWNKILKGCLWKQNQTWFYDISSYKNSYVFYEAVYVQGIAITKKCLFKYIENFTTKNWKFSDKNSDFFIFLLKT